MLKIIIERFKNVYDGTLGRLQIIDDDIPNALNPVIFKCYTLEPRGEDEIRRGLDKRIPQGKYDLRWHDSPKFKRRLLHLYNDKVAKDRYILIHKGNYPEDTLGCILLGESYSKKGVFNSTNAFNRFMAIMLKADLSECKLTIVNKFGAEF